MQSNIGSTQFQQQQTSTLKTEQKPRVPLLSQLNSQILNFAEKYQKAILKFQQAQSFLLYQQQMTYFNSLNTQTQTNTVYPFIINHGGGKNELLVHLGPNVNCHVSKQEKVHQLAGFLNQGSQLHQMMSQYASVLANERVQSHVTAGGSYLDNFENNQKTRLTQSQFPPILKDEHQLFLSTSLKRRKTKDELREDMAQGRDMKETKNIPKNFSKAIITYVIKNQDLCLKVLEDESLYDKFLEYLKQRKRMMSNIKHMSEMLVDTIEDPMQRKFNKTFRIISQHFLKSHSIEYIFNSRIQQINWHLKYRRNILRALKHPERFNQIKHM